MKTNQTVYNQLNLGQEELDLIQFVAKAVAQELLTNDDKGIKLVESRLPKKTREDSENQ